MHTLWLWLCCIPTHTTESHRISDTVSEINRHLVPFDCVCMLTCVPTLKLLGLALCSRVSHGLLDGNSIIQLQVAAQMATGYNTERYCRATADTKKETDGSSKVWIGRVCKQQLTSQGL